MTRPRLLRWRLGAWTLLLTTSGCIDRFTPDVQDVAPNYLVVDGFINAAGVSTVKLSRTFGLNTAAVRPVETQAQVYIEDEQGARYPLPEAAEAGTYSSAALRLDAARRYRLHLYAASQEYASDYTAVRLTPPIDSVSWRAVPAGVAISVSTHDATNQTRYYRWSYDETWEYTSAFQSTVEYVGGLMRPRPDDVYRCWNTRGSTAIRLTDTNRLSQDVVAQYPLLTVAPSAVQLRLKYSILVKQYAQTPEEYDYWELLRRNTESIGSLFDPLPAQLTGNVRCLSTPETPVLGYVGAYTVTEKRIFISRSELPLAWQIPNEGYSSCVLDTVPLARVPSAFNSATTQPVAPVYIRGVLTGYSSGSAPCVDCRLRGTNIRPSFWQ